MFANNVFMKKKLYFIDLFAGCGGLSLGLMKAGFTGLFAIERNKDAFATLSQNLLSSKISNGFRWPKWLPCENMTTSCLLENYFDEILKLRGKVDLVAGGPPCQGFSFVGLRNPNDPRNRLTEEYIKIVSLLQPKLLILENVKGFQSAFRNGVGIMKQPYSEYVVKKLESLPVGYKVFNKILLASEFGVPQPRPRFVMIAIRSDLLKKSQLSSVQNDEFFSRLMQFTKKEKEARGLKDSFTPLRDAIEDLCLLGKMLKKCDDNQNFQQITYKEPSKKSSYLKLMRDGCSKTFEPNSLRIPNHKKETIQKFSYILKHAQRGVTLSKELRKKFNVRKQCFTVLSEKKLSTTITTSPDDCLHYSEPRVLTVRENARIQSFPDWFEFKGKYTTGGMLRREDCPRYSQVGNAVPPLMAEIIGNFVISIIR